MKWPTSGGTFREASGADPPPFNTTAPKEVLGGGGFTIEDALLLHQLLCRDQAVCLLHTHEIDASRQAAEIQIQLAVAH